MQLARSTGNGPAAPSFQQSRCKQQFSGAGRIVLPGKRRGQVGEGELLEEDAQVGLDRVDAAASNYEGGTDDIELVYRSISSFF